MKTNPYIVVVLLLFFYLPVFSQSQFPKYDESFKDHPLIAEADSLANIWQWEKAIPVYGRAMKFFKQQKKWEGYYYAMNCVGNMYQESGESKNAHLIFSQALNEGLELWEEEHPEVARSYFYLGYLYMFGDSSNLIRSLNYCQKALKIRETILPLDHLDLADSYQQLGRYYRQSEKYHISKDLHQKALDIYEEKLDSNSIRLARAFSYFGYTLRDAHVHYRTLYYLQQALSIYEGYHDVPDFEMARITNAIANIYVDDQNFEKAKPFYEKSVKHIILAEGPKSPHLPLLVSNLAYTMIYLEKPDSARTLFHKAISKNLSAEYTDSTYLSYSYEQFAALYYEINMSDSAIYYCKKAIEIQNSHAFQSLPFTAGLYEFLAQCYLKKGNPDSSLIYIQQALVKIDDNFSNLNVYANPSIRYAEYPSIVYKIIATKAEAFYNLYSEKNNLPNDINSKRYLKESIILYTKLDSLGDHFRNNLYSDDFKLLLAKYYKEDADGALLALSEGYNIIPNSKYIDLGLMFMEKNRYAKIYGNQAKVIESAQVGLPDSLYQNEIEILTQIKDVKKSIGDAKDTKEKKQIEDKLFRLEQAHERFQNKVSDQYPSYINVDYGKLLNLKQIQNKLNNHTQILEYFWGDSCIYVVSVSNRASKIAKIELTDRIQKEIDWFLKGIAGLGFDPGDIYLDMDYANYAEIAHSLYDRLLDPFLFENKKRIIISPDGLLSYLPFETLLTDSQPSSWKSAPYLLRKFDIQYTYSCNLLFGRPIAKTSSNPSILAFAYSDSPADGMDGSTTNVNDLRTDLDEIIGSFHEVESIKRLFEKSEPKIFVGDRATESAFKQFSEKYDIIHLAVHGIGDTLNELESSLYFNKSANSEDDGRLFAHEVYGLDLWDLRLAVMSACESGVGKHIAGEGIFSMARGFAYAGCPSIVMSLWNVNDRMTADLMELFYTYLKKGKPIDLALKKAKLDLLSQANLDKQAQPFYWAAFIPIGDTSPVVSSKSNWSVWIVVFVLIIAIAFLIIRKIRS